MSYVENNLVQDEHIIAEAKRSKLLLLSKTFSTAIQLLIEIVAAIVLEKPIAFLLTLVSIGWFVISIIKFFRNKLTLTNKRVIFRAGLFTTRSIDLQYEQVEQVVIDQNFWGKLFHYSTITVSTGGIDFQDLSGVIEGDNLKNMIMAQVDERKKAAAEEQARATAQAMREAFAGMQPPPNPGT